MWNKFTFAVWRKVFRANKAMELLRKDKGPSFGHMVAYYGSAAFKLAHGINIYDYMNKIDTLEYGRVKATT